MKHWSDKIDNANGILGHVSPSEMNSNYKEKKNVVLATMPLKETDNKQMVNSINKLAQSLYYKDNGVVNQIKLLRFSTTMDIETYSDGMTLFFQPAITNTGNVTLSVANLGSKPVLYNDAEVPSGFLVPSSLYMVIFNSVDDRFDLYRIAKTGTTTSGSNAGTGNPNETLQVANGVGLKDVINAGQLSAFVNKSDIVDNVTSTDTTKPLSANQIRLLEEQITNIDISSNDVNLDTLQEIVDYIKANHNDLLSINIASVTGLQDALNDKSLIVHNHDGMHYTKSQIDTLMSSKAPIGGDNTQIFQVGDAVDDNDALNVHMLSLLGGGAGSWEYTETTNPSPDTNPSVDNAKWKNTTTGEMFVCIDRTTDNNVWKGTNGTTVEYTPNGDTTTVVDIFGDGSATGLYDFEIGYGDTGGSGPATAEAVSAPIVTEDAYIGTRCVKVVPTDGGLKVFAPSGKTIRTISFWFKLIAWSSNDNYLISYVDGGGNLNRFSFSNYTGSDIFALTGPSIPYFDGVQVANTDDATAAASGWHNFVIQLGHTDRVEVKLGNYTTSIASACGNGYFDHIRVFDRVLTQAEITQLVSEAPPGQ